MYTWGYDLGRLSQKRDLFLSLKELGLELCFVAPIIPTSNTLYIYLLHLFCYTCYLSLSDSWLLVVATGLMPSCVCYSVASRNWVMAPLCCGF
jgi:hypothetical protein